MGVLIFCPHPSLAQIPTCLLWDFRQIPLLPPTSAFSSRKQYQHHSATLRIKWESTSECTVLCSEKRQDLPEVQRQVSDEPRCVQLQSSCSFHCSPVFHQETHHIHQDEVIHLQTCDGRGLAAFLKCGSWQYQLLLLLQRASLCGLPFWASSKRSFSASH